MDLLNNLERRIGMRKIEVRHDDGCGSPKLKSKVANSILKERRRRGTTHDADGRKDMFIKLYDGTDTAMRWARWKGTCCHNGAEGSAGPRPLS